MTTKGTLRAHRRRIIRNALAKLERELKNELQENPAKERLRKWLAEVEQTFRSGGKHVLH